MKWESPGYPQNYSTQSTVKFQFAGGYGISSPSQAVNPYKFTTFYSYSQTPFANRIFFGSAANFKWWVRDICSVGDTSEWTGPYTIYGKIEEQSSEVSSSIFSIYPNPNNGNELNLNVAGLSKAAKVFVYDNRGSLVLEIDKVSNGTKAISIGELSSGIYSVSLRNDEIVVTERLVVQR